MAEEEKDKELVPITDMLQIRRRTVLEMGLKLHADIWSEDEKFWAYYDKYPDRLKHRLRSFDTFFSRLQHIPGEPHGKRRWSPEDIEAEGMTEAEIQEAAFGKNGNSENSK